MAKGWTTVALKEELAARIDSYLKGSGKAQGYTSRADFLADAARRLVEMKERESAELRFIESQIAQRAPADSSKGKSTSESGKPPAGPSGGAASGDSPDPARGRPVSPHSKAYRTK